MQKLATDVRIAFDREKMQHTDELKYGFNQTAEMTHNVLMVDHPLLKTTFLQYSSAKHFEKLHNCETELTSSLAIDS
jgi:hypothetical protein